MAVFSVWLLSAVSIILFIDHWDQRGQFGDMFGAINALFSAFAFAVLIYTIWMQREQLELQRQELEQTREELSRAADAQEESEKLLNAQVELLTLSAFLSTTTALFEAHQRAKSDETGRYGAELTTLNEQMRRKVRDLEIMIKNAGPRKSD